MPVDPTERLRAVAAWLDERSPEIEPHEVMMDRDVHPFDGPPRHRGRLIVTIAAVAAVTAAVVMWSTRDQSLRVHPSAPAPGATKPGPDSKATSGVPTTIATTLTTTSTTAAVPPDFRAGSVTFVSLRTGWVLGTAECATARCAAVLRTRDGGATWRSVPAPPVAVSQAPRLGGHAEIRFANLLDGWIAGDRLWATHDGGAHWREITQLPLSGPSLAVQALDTNGSRVYAAYFEDGSVTRVVLASSAVAGDDWTVSTTLRSSSAGPVPLTLLTLQGTSGWVIQWDRGFVDGARLVGGGWLPWGGPCPDLTGHVAIAAATSTDVVAMCDDNYAATSQTPQGWRVSVSRNAGLSFSSVATTLLIDQLPTAIASPAADVAIAVADGASGALELTRSADGGKTWAPVAALPGSSGANDLGFTSPTQGVVVTPDGQLLMSHDGGRSWVPRAFQASR